MTLRLLHSPADGRETISKVNAPSSFTRADRQSRAARKRIAGQRSRLTVARAGLTKIHQRAAGTSPPA